MAKITVEQQSSKGVIRFVLRFFSKSRFIRLIERGSAKDRRKKERLEVVVCRIDLERAEARSK